MMKKSMMKKAGAAGLAVCVAATTGIAVHYTPVSRAKTVDTQKAVEKNYPNSAHDMSHWVSDCDQQLWGKVCTGLL